MSPEQEPSFGAKPHQTNLERAHASVLARCLTAVVLLLSYCCRTAAAALFLAVDPLWRCSRRTAAVTLSPGEASVLSRYACSRTQRSGVQGPQECYIQTNHHISPVSCRPLLSHAAVGLERRQSLRPEPPQLTRFPAIGRSDSAAAKHPKVAAICSEGRNGCGCTLRRHGMVGALQCSSFDPALAQENPATV